MKKSTPSLPVLVVIAVLALILGSIGTAVAAPALTKGSVKKIATKVVKKQAPTLSVGFAANAGSATNLNGQPASAYLNKSYVYPVTGNSPDGTITFALPGLPAGKYLVNYNVAAAVGGAPGFFVCYFGTFGAKRVPALGALSGNWWVTGAGYLDTTTGGTPAFECTGGTSITIPGASVPQSQVVLTRLDDVTTTPAPGSRGSGARPGSATR